IVKTKFKWIEQALFPTVSISGNYQIIFIGNIISKNSCVFKAQKLAHVVSIVNIRDEHGKSVWPEKNSEADIDEFLRLLSYASQQKEFFNNPIEEGTVFTQMSFGRIRPLREYKYLICYTDPSFKDSKK